MSRAVRLEQAAQAAIERVAARDAAATSEDLFADLGEALYWLAALMDETRTPGGVSRDPLLAGLRWARNRVTHGAIVSAPVAFHRAFTMRRSSLRGGDALRGVGHRWVVAEEIPAGPRDWGYAKWLPEYRAHVSGRSVVRTLREGLLLARGAAQ